MLTSARLIPICVMTTPIAQTAKGLTRARVGEDFPEMERFVMVCLFIPNISTTSLFSVFTLLRFQTTGIRGRRHNL